MKALLFILLFILTLSNKADSQSLISDGDIYLYEYAIKKPTRLNIRFIVIDKGVITQNIDFTVNFSKNKVKKICRSDKTKTNTLQYVKTEDGNVLIGQNDCWYSSDNFVNKKKRIPDDFYKMISPSFLKMTNKERLEILNELSTK